MENKQLWEDILRFAADINATDIHLSADNKVVIRYNGNLYKIDEFTKTEELFKKYPVLKNPLPDKLVTDLIREAQEGSLSLYTTYQDVKNADFSYQKGDNRYRINSFFRMNKHAMAVRILPLYPTLNKIFEFMPEHGEILKNATNLPHGIVLITGATGSGKSTTLAALINYLNENFRKHIISLEDPVEFAFSSNKSLVSQRELGTDMHSFPEGLRAALREDPDIILVGEMRDKETIQTALEAARTGHLVFSTLHTNRALDTIMRIINVFPEEKQNEIILDLSETLRLIFTQALVRRKDNKRTVAAESLVMDETSAKLIRSRNFDDITKRASFQPLEKSIKFLADKNIIAKEEVLKYIH
jgi:twitching motility protein PilT